MLFLDWKIPALLVALSLLSAVPLLAGNYVFQSDFQAASLRALELNVCLNEGIAFPRWSPDFYGGNGAPLFNFYAPFSYYLVQPFVFAGMGFATAVHLVWFLSMLAAALGAFLFARKFASEKAAFAGAVFYSFFSYHLTDVFVRGAFAESIAYAILPFAAFLFLEAAEGRKIIPAAAVYAILIFTHSPSSFLFTAFFVPYVLAKSFLQKGWSVKSIPNGFVFALLLGLGLSAFFWIPALFEQNLIHFERIDFGFNEQFLAPGDFFGLPSFAREKALHLGVLDSLAVLAGVAFALFAERKKFGAEAAFVLAIAFFVTPLSLPFWPDIAKSVQFSWRLLPVLALFSIPLACGLMERLGFKTVIAFSVLFAAFGFSMVIPVGYYDHTLQWYDAQITRANLLSLKNDLSYNAEYAPASTIATLTLDEPVVQYGVATSKTYCYEKRISINAEKDSFVVADLFYHQAWNLAIDGVSEGKPSNDRGFVKFGVPAGMHEARIYYEETPLEKASWVVFGISVLAAAAFYAFKRKS